MKLTENVREFLDKKAGLLAAGFYAFIASEFDENEDRQIESPIEQLFYIEWRFRQFNHYDLMWDILPQYQGQETGRYRIDFCVSFIDEMLNKFGSEGYASNPIIKHPSIGIEIDGHIWHEKTKEQVQYHKERERFLIAGGWKLIRFTGTEVYKDPVKCVDEAIKIIIPIRDEYYAAARPGKKQKEK